MKYNNLSEIDTTFDFRQDSKGDPDSGSPLLRSAHRLLWSKQLPNGQLMDLNEEGTALRWNDMLLSSDSILVSFRYKRNQAFTDSLKESMHNYHEFIEDFLVKADTIGGFIVFPKEKSSINQRRGCDNKICDRWDLTLECIRRYYQGEVSPLYDTLSRFKSFFDLFVDFKGYVDFFFLQDCVSEDYGCVKMWLDTELFVTNPIPKDKDTYVAWIEKELAFLSKRNERIRQYCKENDTMTI